MNFGALARLARRSRIAAAAAAALLAGAALSACSENAGETRNPTVSGNTGPADVLAIEARDFSFVPNHLEARLGEPITVEFLNSGSSKHSISFYNDAGHEQRLRAAEIEPVEAGKSSELTFESPPEAATLYFRCEVHPDRMRGEVSVGA